MIYEPPERPRRRTQRSILDSPALSALLVVVVVGLAAAIVFLPGILSPSGAAPTASAAVGAGTPVATGPSAEPTFVRPTPSPAPTFVSYLVRAGDSLNAIAKQFRTTARSIAWWNRGAYPGLDPQSPDYAPNTIRVGWVLAVMPDSVVDDNNPPPVSPDQTPGPTAR
jgi:Tfp pilus assembly protein FimV